MVCVLGDRHPGIELGAFGREGLEAQPRIAPLSANEKVKPAAVFTKPRRLSSGGLNGLVRGQASFAARWMVLHDARIGAAAADVAVHAATICSFVGFLFFASNSAACMIWPDWQ